MSCPQPVLETKELIEQYPDELIEILVDNKASFENVTKFLKSQGWSVKGTTHSEGYFVITGAPGTCEITHDKGDEPAPDQKILVFIPADTFGAGDENLGKSLMKNFLHTLKELGSDLWRIILVNSGVKLTVATSPVITELKALEDSGVTILVCGTCLQHFELMEKKVVGETTNMLDIVTSMQLATKVIRV